MAQKPLFKSEIKHIAKVRDVLSISCKLNGTQVILGEANRAALREANDALNLAISKLLNIN